MRTESVPDEPCDSHELQQVDPICQARYIAAHAFKLQMEGQGILTEN